MSNAHDLELPDLIAGIVENARDLVEAQLGSLRNDLGDRVAELGVAIRSWLIALAVAIVALLLLGLALAASVHALGASWLTSLWSVTSLAVLTVVGLFYRARANSRIAAAPSSEPGPPGNLLAAAPTP